MMEALFCSKTLVLCYQTTQYGNPKDHNKNLHYCNLYVLYPTMLAYCVNFKCGGLYLIIGLECFSILRKFT